ncbi:IDEAL domain-containing protein [Priestia sp. SB1]|uniref:IDEAL domain-containing protein n=1 Tax=Priestia sp. SB1 TaxID=3132359 RepID=UPI003179458D
MERKFTQEDNIKYSLKEYEGEVKLLHYNKKTREVEYLEVVVTKSDNPEILENSTQWISHKNFEYVELLSYDTCNLNHRDYGELDKLMNLLEEKLVVISRDYKIDQALINGDKELFLKLTGDSQ